MNIQPDSEATMKFVPGVMATSAAEDLAKAWNKKRGRWRARALYEPLQSVVLSLVRYNGSRDENSQKLADFKEALDRGDTSAASGYLAYRVELKALHSTAIESVNKALEARSGLSASVQSAPIAKELETTLKSVALQLSQGSEQHKSAVHAVQSCIELAKNKPLLEREPASLRGTSDSIYAPPETPTSDAVHSPSVYSPSVYSRPETPTYGGQPMGPGGTYPDRKISEPSVSSILPSDDLSITRAQSSAGTQRRANNPARHSTGEEQDTRPQSHDYSPGRGVQGR